MPTRLRATVSGTIPTGEPPSETSSLMVLELKNKFSALVIRKTVSRLGLSFLLVSASRSSESKSDG